MNKLKILHINTLVFGGAAQAAIRLHNGLLNMEYDSQFLTLSTNGANIKAHIQFPEKSEYGYSILNRIRNKIGIRKHNSFKRQKDFLHIGNRIELFSSPITDFKVAQFINDKLDVDVVNLHWVSNFIDYEEFFSNIKKPIVWTLHDENPYGSYWHYSMDHILNKKELDIHQKYLIIKQNAIKKHKNELVVVTPSVWLKNNSESSEILGGYRHKLVPNGINTNVFKVNADHPDIANDFEKKDNQTIGLFICQALSNKRKGFHVLMDAINEIKKTENILFIAVGKIDDEFKQKVPENIIFTNEINDEFELARLYNFADFTIIPSLMDNLPNTMLESLCCGTPILGTPAGGIAETISQNNFGIISSDFTSKGLVDIMKKFRRNLSNYDKNEISANAYKMFNLNLQASSYTDLYKEILKM